MASKKGPNSIDVHVGSRVRMRRMMLHMSQEKLGEALGITFQQVQKYEKGMNRISSSRLQQLSDILQVPVAFFFEDGAGPQKSHLGQAAVDDIRQFVTSHEGLRLIQAFSQIKSDTLRRSIVRLVSELAVEADRCPTSSKSAIWSTTGRQIAICVICGAPTPSHARYRIRRADEEHERAAKESELSEA